MEVNDEKSFWFNFANNTKAEFIFLLPKGWSINTLEPDIEPIRIRSSNGASSMSIDLFLNQSSKGWQSRTTKETHKKMMETVLGILLDTEASINNVSLHFYPHDLSKCGVYCGLAVVDDHLVIRTDNFILKYQKLPAILSISSRFEPKDSRLIEKVISSIQGVE